MEVKSSYQTALCLAAFPVVTGVAAMLGLLVGIPVSAAPAVLGLLASGVLAWRFKRVGIVAGIIGAALLFGSLKLVDAEWDGKTIHKPAALLLAKGWNPVYESSVEQALAVGETSPEKLSALWCVHYPKMAWAVNASLYRLSGNIDLGDGVAIVWMGVLFFTAVSAFAGLYCVRGAALYAPAACAALNPIVVRELVCGYVDGLLVLSLCTGVLALALWRQAREHWLLVLACGACVYGANLKFTGLLYFGVAYGVVCLVHGVQIWREGLRASNWSPFGLFAVATVLLVAACGVSPYVLNWVDGGSPFFPLHSFRTSAEVLNISSQWYAADAARMGAWGRLVYSHAPFAEWVCELKPYSRNDLCMRFSQFFRVALLLSAAGLVWWRRSDVVVWALVASIVVQPEAWHGRYIPQIWLLPIIGACLLPKLRWVVPSLLLLALLPALSECREQLFVQAMRCRALPNLGEFTSGEVFTYTGSPQFAREYDFYWESFLRDAGVRNYRRIVSVPEERAADFWIYDLRVYADSRDVAKRGTVLGSVLRFRWRQLVSNWRGE